MRVELAIPISLKFIKAVLEVPTADKDRDITVRAISNDTRELIEGDLYIATPGERFSGEEFIDEAKSKGAYTVSSKYKNADIFVCDTMFALMKLAKEYK